MKTSPTETFQPDPAGAGETLLVFIGESGAAERWLLIDADMVTMRGDGAPPVGAGRTILAVPGTQVAIHWLALAGDLAPAQAAAAARLMLAAESAEPLADMHVAVGTAEGGMTPAALVPNLRMAEWLAGDIDPDAVIPLPLLLARPETGFVRRGPDHRGPEAAFALEPDLAEALIAGAPVEEVDEARFEEKLAPLLAAPPLNLRQGAFARRRQWRIDRPRLRRITLFAIALALLSLVVQVATILSYTFAADRLEQQVSARSATAAGPREGPGFAALAAILFDAVRSTPNAELSRLEYRPDASLAATVMADSPATLAALRTRLEASGLAIEAGAVRGAGGRQAVDLMLRPS